MMKAFGITRGLVGITGLFQLVLGILFWTGHARSLVNTHMAVGLLFVLSLWVLAGLSARAHAPSGLIIGTFAWGVVVVAFGMAQTRLVLGTYHWIVQVAHLLVGVIAMALAGRLQMAVRRTSGGRGAGVTGDPVAVHH